MKVIPFRPSDPQVYFNDTEEQGIGYRSHTSLQQHNEMQISMVIKGEGTLVIGNYSQAFKKGEVYIIGANQPHCFKQGTSHAGIADKGTQISHLYFDVKRIPETFFLLHELGSVRKFISSCTTGIQIPPEHEVQATTLIQAIHNKTGLERLLGSLEILHFFSTISSGWRPLSTGFYNFTISKSEGKRMNDVFKYTLDNYAEDITLNKIASIAHITPHAFCKYFKQHTRKTYNNFLSEVRVNEACKKIISGSYDGLSAIAYQTGFKGASNFNRVFKKTTGMSPSDYKKEFRNKTA